MAQGTKAPTVYLMYGKGREVLYVGCSMEPWLRLAAHQNQRDWWREVVNVEVEHFDTPDEASEREREYIRTLCPRHNIKSRTDLPRLPRVQIRWNKGQPVDPWDAFPGHRKFLSDFRQQLFAIHPRLHDSEIAEMLGLTLREYQNLGSRPGGIPDSIFERRDEVMAQFARLVGRRTGEVVMRA